MAISGFVLGIALAEQGLGNPAGEGFRVILGAADLEAIAVEGHGVAAFGDDDLRVVAVSNSCESEAVPAPAFSGVGQNRKPNA